MTIQTGNDRKSGDKSLFPTTILLELTLSTESEPAECPLESLPNVCQNFMPKLNPLLPSRRDHRAILASFHSSNDHLLSLLARAVHNWNFSEWYGFFRSGGDGHAIA